MPIVVRPRGQRYELRVRHRLLPRPFYATFATDAEAQAYGQQLDAMLDRGVVPHELLAPAERSAAADPLLVAILRAYLAQAQHLTASDEALLPSLVDELVGVRLSGVSYRWAMDWVRRMKWGDRPPVLTGRQYKAAGLAPGTIRKRIGALARVIDWHLAQHATAAHAVATNALRLLPQGYSQYSPAERRDLAAQGLQGREDEHRDLRLMPEQDAHIRAVLAGHRRPDRERAWGTDADMALMYAVIIDTGLRLREAFTLRVDQVDLQRGVLRVEGTKGARGRAKPRTVPLKRVLREPLASHCAGRVGLVWPFWDGSPEGLARTTRRLSARFGTLFAYAGLPQLTEHDLRHEAACRWFELRDERGAWVFSDIEVCRIMGWASLAMALRYASLRGEDLAARLA